MSLFERWRKSAREQLEEVRNLIDFLDYEVDTQGPEWRAAGDLEAFERREQVRELLELEEIWWESFAPRGEQW